MSAEISNVVGMDRTNTVIRNGKKKDVSGASKGVGTWSPDLEVVRVLKQGIMQQTERREKEHNESGQRES